MWTEMSPQAARGQRSTPEVQGASGPGSPSYPDAATRKPLHPGYFLETRFLKPIGLSQSEFAQKLGVSRRRVNELVRGRRGISVDTAVRLARFFGNDAEFWMRLQLAWDIHSARKKLRARAGGS